MKFVNPCVAVLACLLFVGGCASSGSAASSGKNTPAAPQQRVQSTGSATSQEAQVKAQLDTAGRDLVGRASRTVMPSKAKPKVFKGGKDYVAQYVEVDQNSFSTTMRPGTTSSTPYVGVIEYREVTKECRGATKQKAMTSTACQEISSRNMKELIRYDGKSWQF